MQSEPVELLEIRVKPSADIDQSREQTFGKATFHCKGKPRKKALADRIVGSIKQGRSTYWVVSKPRRQIGDRPKVEKKMKLDADLVDFIEATAEAGSIYQVEVVEAALRMYRERSTIGN